MKVLVDIGHPGQVHFFKNMMWNLKERGHDVKIVARDKEIVLYLLDAYGFEYEIIGKTETGLLNKGLSMIKKDLRLYRICKKFRPDVLTNDGGLYPAHVGKLIGKPSVVFTETEHARFQNWMSFPFCDVICTPSCFYNDLGKKQIRYEGYHELAYLHPNYFKPDQGILEKVGLDKDDKLFIIRFVSWGAAHDEISMGAKEDEKLELVNTLEKEGRVFISSESGFKGKLEKYKIPIKPEDIHHLINYATMYVGEGGTMASEAAVLGTPSIYVNPLRLGYIEELRDRYGLIHNAKTFREAIEMGLNLLKNNKLKEDWAGRKTRMLHDKIDVTKFMVNLIERSGK